MGNYIDGIELLKNDYNLIIPILDGHFGSDKNFISIEDNAREIINFIDNNFDGKVKLIYGLYLSGQIALEIIFKEIEIMLDYENKKVITLGEIIPNWRV